MGHLTHLQKLCATAFRWLWVTGSNASGQALTLPAVLSQCSTPVPWVEWDPSYAGVDLLFEVTPAPFPRAGRRQASRSHCTPISQQPRTELHVPHQLWDLGVLQPGPPAVPTPLPCWQDLSCALLPLWYWAVQAKEAVQLGTTEVINVRGNGGFTLCKLQVPHIIYHKIPIVCNAVWWTELHLDGLIELCFCFPHNVGLMS